MNWRDNGPIRFAILAVPTIIGIFHEGAHQLFDRITFNPLVMGGRACIRGMRIPVSTIVGQIAHGATIDEVLDDYPDLEPADIEQALLYSAWRWCL